jgi:hypothetical protein
VKKIPADIDQLMWSVAESGDVKAVDEFEQRFPDFKIELAKRLMMVRGLRGAKETSTGKRTIPEFRPKQQETGFRAYPVRLAAGLLVLVFLAGLSYTITRSLLQAQHEPTNTVKTDDEGQPWSPEHVFSPQPEPERSVAVATNPQEELPAEYRNKISLTIDGAPLDQVLAMVAEAAKLQLDIAPGMNNPTVAMAYQNVTGIAILEDMGKQLGFTPFYQGNGKVLIVPAVDPKRLADSSPSLGSAQVVEEPEGTDDNRNKGAKHSIEPPPAAH